MTSTRRSATAPPRRARASCSRPPAWCSPTTTWSTVEQGISVRLTSTGRHYPATEIGGDTIHDVAVLQIQGASGFATAPIGNSSDVQIGDSVTALGNAEGRGGSPAVATGQVTALGQTITASDETGNSTETLNGMIQTNAPIQPGDSGGPLINSNGQVIGMDTAASGGRRGPQPGAVESFAIPINTALNYAHQLLAHPAAPPSGAFLGVCPQDDTAQAGALVVVGLRDRHGSGQREPRCRRQGSRPGT